MDETARAVIAEARRWIGTPYRHQASVWGAGCDCLGLVRGIWRALHGNEPMQIPSYTPDWNSFGGGEPMLDAARSVCVPLEQDEPGALVLFRWQPAGPARHAGIITENGRFIHAYERAGVVETRLGQAWRSRMAACFRFPPPTFSKD